MYCEVQSEEVKFLRLLEKRFFYRSVLINRRSNLTIEENNEQPSKSNQSAILLLRVNVNLDSLKIPIPTTYYHHLVVDSDLLEDEREHSFTGGQ